MAANHGSVRRSQIVTTYGPGAMIAVENEAFMVAGLERWDVTEQVSERRLEQRLSWETSLPASGRRL